MRDRLIELLIDTLSEWECEVRPETVAEIAEHLIDNGVIVPPCKLGASIYVPVISEDGEFEPYVAICPATDISAKRIFVSQKSPPGDDFYDYYYISDIGKTFFLTPEAAEQALKGGANK